VKVLLAWLALLSLAAPLQAALLEGRVVSGAEPLAGVTVAAYATLDPTSAPVLVAAPTPADGTYRLELPPGSYALFGWSQDRRLFAFCGRNPLNLVAPGDRVWAGLQAVAVPQVTVTADDDPYAAAIEGQVLLAGEPVSGAYVSLYLDAAEDLKGQGYRMSQPTDATGYFAFDGLPESNYFLVVRQRQNGQRVGPVREGDLFGVYPGNPLTARAGERTRIVLPVVTKQQDAVESETFGRASGPVLQGLVVDAAGQGVAGLHVFAYTDRVIGHQRPAAISTPTAADGRFVVNLPAAGTYYVGARQAYGDSPAPGELFGMYEETADHGLEVKADETREGLRIVVEPIELF